MTREEVMQAMEAGTTQEIEDAVVAVALEESDYDFALDTVLRAAGSSDSAVRGTAILCLGHIARIHRRLPEQPVVAIVNSGLRDEAQYVRGQAENAADDIETFLPELGMNLQRVR